MAAIQFLSPRQWQLLQPVFADPCDDRRHGRPPVYALSVLEGVLYIVLKGCAWNKLPFGYPSFMTCFRHYNDWLENGIWENVLAVLLDDLAQRTGCDLCRDWGSFVQYDSLGHVSRLRLPPELFIDRENLFVLMLFMRNFSPVKQNRFRRRIKA
jgi:transposase